MEVLEGFELMTMFTFPGKWLGVDESYGLGLRIPCEV